MEREAAESGMDLKAYAEASGKAHSTLFKKVAAWRVLSAKNFHVEIFGNPAETTLPLAFNSNAINRAAIFGNPSETIAPMN